MAGRPVIAAAVGTLSWPVFRDNGDVKVFMHFCVP